MGDAETGPVEDVGSIDILLASHNGAGTLGRVFEAWRELVDPGVAWRAVVIDNASDDDTRSIVEEYARDLPIEYVYEGRRGKNRALNAGLEHLRGDLVVFTDDDSVPDPSWLLEMRACALRNRDASLFGGTIEPDWPCEPPEWILRDVPLEVTFTFDTTPRVEGPASPGLILGPNMAVRRMVFRAGHRFDESIGPGRGQYMMGSESEFAHRAALLGYGCCHAPRAVVRHIIGRHQLDREWILARAFRYGRYSCRRDRFGRSDAEEVATLFGTPRYLVRMFLAEWVRRWRCRLLFDRSGAFRAEWQMRFLRGRIHEERACRRGSG